MVMAALVISLVALVVAIVTGLIVFFGKPKFEDSYEKTLGYALTCWIKSVPPSKFLSWIGVYRRILDIDCMTTIKDMDGNIVSSFPYLTASSKNMRIPVVGIKDKDDGRVFLKDQNNRYDKMLNVGSYIFELEIWDAKDGLQKRKRQKYFMVNPNNPFVEWIT
jgi:hypothetical protein